MNQITIWITANITWILIATGVLLLLCFILIFWLFFKLNQQQKRYNFFMGINRRPTHNLETQLTDYYEKVSEIHKKYDQILGIVEDLDGKMQSSVQKVGMIRYNPYSEMGGNLCFAAALLDGEDNGIVLNGIHSRTGSFTYAKPVIAGQSSYILSQEEKTAIEMAQKNAYQPKAEKVIRVVPKKVYRLRPKETISEMQPTFEEDPALEQEPLMPSKETETITENIAKTERTILSDEKERIQYTEEPAAPEKDEIPSDTETDWGKPQSPPGGTFWFETDLGTTETPDDSNKLE